MTTEIEPHKEVAPSGPKEKVKRLPKPNRDNLNKQLELIDAEIKKHHERIAELKQMIDDKMAGKDVSSAQSREVANRIAALNNDFDIKLGQKKVLQKQLDEVRKSHEDLKAAARDLRGTLQFIKLEDIEVQIARLEEKLNHSTVDLTEERRMIDQMRDLTKSRAKVLEYQQQVERIQNDQGVKDELAKKIQDLESELTSIKARKEEEKATLQRLREKEAGKAQDIPSLMAAKQAAWDVTLELREAKKKMLTEFRALEDEYYARERLWREQQKEARHQQYLQRQAARDARDAERKFLEDALKGDPYAEELTTCDQLLAYLARFRGGPQEAKVEEAKPVAALEGMKVLRKKLNDDELDDMYAGVGKKGKGKAPAKKEEGKREDANARITHTLDIITSFDRVKVAAPTTRGQAEAAIGQVEEKKRLFEELQRKELEERAARRAAGELSEEEEEEEGEGAEEGEGKEGEEASTSAPAASEKEEGEAKEAKAAAAPAPAPTPAEAPPRKSAWGKPVGSEEEEKKEEAKEEVAPAKESEEVKEEAAAAEEKPESEEKKEDAAPAEEDA